MTYELSFNDFDYNSSILFVHTGNSKFTKEEFQEICDCLLEQAGFIALEYAKQKNNFIYTSDLEQAMIMLLEAKGFQHIRPITATFINLGTDDIEDYEYYLNNPDSDRCKCKTYKKLGNALKPICEHHQSIKDNWQENRNRKENDSVK